MTMPKCYRWCKDRGSRVLFTPTSRPWKSYVYASINPESWRYRLHECYEIETTDSRVLVVNAENEPGLGQPIDDWLKEGIPITEYKGEFDFDTVLIPFPVWGVRVSKERRDKFLETYDE